MATLAAEGLGFLCQFMVRFSGENDLLSIFGEIMLFVALIAGCLTLLLTPLTTRLAKTRPPRVLVQLAYVAGVLPIVTLVLQYVLK